MAGKSQIKIKKNIMLLNTKWLDEILLLEYRFAQKSC